MTDPDPELAKRIDDAVAPQGFRRFEPAAADPSLSWIAAWKRKTWNTNRGIALLHFPAEAPHAGEYALDVRVKAGKPLGYIPFLYELGLQLILVGPGILKKGERLTDYVTKVNNSTVLLQSLHLVDPDERVALSARTWGQLVTGKFIDAIELGIAAFLGAGKP